MARERLGKRGKVASAGNSVNGACTAGAREIFLSRASLLTAPPNE